ncbi:multiple sugar transport system substrate-binding protein [Micromonospora pisi]|uniref:Multiple sugar transport system substrate-binding protein n=1 Tax=Micromonospora pisi TaxID=589240 RepID=A0A495JTK5_9ACTN|nr:extracellular solute-binding protein [Micromonospora pisi]RKR92323.1 multiple sugar transport system substrate-binding protein [Micromonospora pisi]
MSRSSTGRRRLVASLAAATLALGMTACGDDDSESTDQSVTMWTFKNTHVAALEQVAAEFKTKTGISVEIEAYTPDDVFTSKIQSAAQTGDLADVLELHAGGEDLRVGGAGLLGDLAPDFPESAMARFLPSTRSAGLVTEKRRAEQEEVKNAKVGSLFSVPFTAGTFGIVYGNRGKMRAAGLDPDKPPRTWEEFIGYLQATTTADPKQGGLSLGLKVSQTGFNWIYEQLAFAYLGQAGFEALFDKNPAQGFASPEGLQTLRLYQQLTPHWIPGVSALGIDEADVAFAQGKSAFNVGGTFTLAFLSQNGMPAENLITFPIPPATGGKVSDLRLAPLALTGLSVSSQTKNRESAVKWIEHLTSPEGSGAFAKASLDLPATDLGAQAATLLGPKLAALQQYFTGPQESTYDAANRGFRPPDYDEVQVGDPLVKFSPLGETDPAATAAQLDKVLAAMWQKSG